MALCIDTKTSVTDSIDESIREVFSMMVDAELTQVEPTQDPRRCIAKINGDGMITVVMGLTGDLQGSLTLTMTGEAAIDWTRGLIEIESDEVDQTVVDAVGELGNMVVGGAKHRLTDFHLTMSLPSVIHSGIDQIGFSSRVDPIHLVYQFGDHPVTVLIALNS